jgi:hypothetical protein
MRTLQCDVDHLHTPAVLRKISIAVARDSSYAAASRNLEDLAELKVSAKQCQRIAIRIGNERLDEQQERIDAYVAQSVPDQQHGQSDDAPANGWEGRVAVVQCDGGRVQVRDDLWGKDKPAGKKHRWWRSEAFVAARPIAARFFMSVFFAIALAPCRGIAGLVFGVAP